MYSESIISKEAKIFTSDISGQQEKHLRKSDAIRLQSPGKVRSAADMALFRHPDKKPCRLPVKNLHALKAV